MGGSVTKIFDPAGLFTSEDAGPPPMPPIPQEPIDKKSEKIETEADKARQRITSQDGRASTILTKLGDSEDEKPRAKKVLLGQ